MFFFISSSIKSTITVITLVLFHFSMNCLDVWLQFFLFVANVRTVFTGIVLRFGLCVSYFLSIPSEEFISWEKLTQKKLGNFAKLQFLNDRIYNDIYRIFTNSFRGNYSFLNLTLCTVTFAHSTYRCGNYSRAETIRGNTVF